MTEDSTGQSDVEIRQFGQKNTERRRERRRSIVGRVRLILETPGAPSYECMLIEASDHGYRLVGADLRAITVPPEVVIELADGSKQRMAVRWNEEGELGLEVIGDN